MLGAFLVGGRAACCAIDLAEFGVGFGRPLCGLHVASLADVCLRPPQALAALHTHALRHACVLEASDKYVAVFSDLLALAPSSHSGYGLMFRPGLALMPHQISIAGPALGSDNPIENSD